MNPKIDFKIAKRYGLPALFYAILSRNVAVVKYMIEVLKYDVRYLLPSTGFGFFNGSKKNLENKIQVIISWDARENIYIDVAKLNISSQNRLRCKQKFVFILGFRRYIVRWLVCRTIQLRTIRFFRYFSKPSQIQQNDDSGVKEKFQFKYK